MPDDAAALKMSQGLGSVVDDAIEEFGEAAVRRALALVPLLADVRAHSQWALNAASQAVEAGMPFTLILRVDPAAKARGERTEARLVSGASHQLVLDFA